jgi:hypothetical protein
LAEAINCAVDEGTSELSSILLLSMIRTAGPENFTDQRMRKYLDTIISTGNSETIRKYVDFMNANTVKGPDDSKEFLKRMAHAVLGMPLKARDNPTGIDRGERQVLLEDIGHAWIRKSMPTAEINWLE